METRNLLASVIASGDFNGDGHDDLALGMPDQNGTAGEVRVIYGNSLYFGYQTWDQSKLGRSGSVFQWSPQEVGDRFGAALAVGDFNRDGKDDLAIGVPGQDVNGDYNAGAVHVIYGSSLGLNAAGNQYWHQDLLSSSDGTQGSDEFGAVLAAGDFTGDRKDDLAIGVPREDVDGVRDAGAVNVIVADSYVDRPLSAQGNQTWHQNVYRLEGDGAQTNDRFGSALAVGDFNRDNLHDLVVGVPMEDVGGDIDAGAIHVIYGYEDGVPRGLNVRSNQYWTQDDLNFTSTESGDRFGASLAVGNLNGDRTGFDDLAVGAPNEDWGTTSDAGAVHVIFGDRRGLIADNNQILVQGYRGIAGRAESGDEFGYSLAISDANQDGYEDLIVGVPGQTVDGVWSAGVVQVVGGKKISGVVSGGYQRTLHKANIGKSYLRLGSGDRFGTQVLAMDWVGDGNKDDVIAIDQYGMLTDILNA